MSSQLSKSTVSDTMSGTNNLAADIKPTGEAQTKVRPCCVCTDEKSARDECMLFSTAKDAQEDCKSLVDRYRTCMKGYGFTV